MLLTLAPELHRELYAAAEPSSTATLGVAPQHPRSAAAARPVA